MDFGEYFKKLLEKKNANLTHLAKQLGIKSKNEIYRVFNNKYSYEKAGELTRRILDVLDITDDERSETLSRLESLRIKHTTRQAMEILSGLYIKRDITYSKKILILRDLLEKHKDADVQIFLGVEADVDTVMFLDEYMTENDNVTVKQSLYFNKPDDILAGELFTVIKLAHHRGYECYECSHPVFADMVVLADYGGKCCAAFEYNGDYVESDISRELYDMINSRCAAANKRPLKYYKTRLSDYVETIEKFGMFEENDTFCFDGMFNFMEIPFDILTCMLKDSNYFGMPSDCDYIKSLLAITRKRYELKYNSDKRNRFVISEDSIKTFLSTRKTNDHFYYFRPLTRSEVKRMVKEMYDRTSRYEYRILKDDCVMPKDIICAAVDNCGIVIYDTDSGYGDEHFQIIISNNRAEALYKKFTEYFWENFTLPEKESREKLRKFMRDFYN